MKDVWLLVSLLKVGSMETHNYQGPVQLSVNWNQKEVLAEDIHILRSKLLSAWQ